MKSRFITRPMAKKTCSLRQSCRRPGAQTLRCAPQLEAGLQLWLERLSILEIGRCSDRKGRSIARSQELEDNTWCPDTCSMRGKAAWLCRRAAADMPPRHGLAQEESRVPSPPRVGRLDIADALLSSGRRHHHSRRHHLRSCRGRLRTLRRLRGLHIAVARDGQVSMRNSSRREFPSSLVYGIDTFIHIYMYVYLVRIRAALDSTAAISVQRIVSHPPPP